MDYFERLRKIADPIDGSVLIPGDRFYRWRPNLTGETLALANEDLILVHTREEEEKKVDEDQKEEEESKEGFNAA